MPYSNKAKQLEYQRKWIASRRTEWFNGKVCAKCESSNNLELDHIDQSTKITHNIWSWSKSRMQKELLKCQPLCSDCHSRKTSLQNRSVHKIPNKETGERSIYFTGKNYRVRICNMGKEYYKGGISTLKKAIEYRDKTIIELDKDKLL